MSRRPAGILRVTCDSDVLICGPLFERHRLAVCHRKILVVLENESVHGP